VFNKALVSRLNASATVVLLGLPSDFSCAQNAFASGRGFNLELAKNITLRRSCYASLVMSYGVGLCSIG